MSSNQNKPWYKRPLVLISISAGFVGLAAGGIWLYKKSTGNSDAQRSGKSGDDFDQFTPQNTTSNKALPAPVYSAPANDGFPLRIGSRGKNVEQLQQAIINVFGKSALPKFGADGDWGSETQRFFDANPGLKSVIDITTFSQYATGKFPGVTSSPTAPKPNTTASNSIITQFAKALIPSWVTDPFIQIGWKLWDAAQFNKFSEVLALLSRLNSTGNYTSASQGFQLRPFRAPLRRYTLVSGLMEAFPKAEQKDTLRKEFRRMGLKETVKNSDPANYDSTWALSGFEAQNKNVRTTMSAIITDGFNIRVAVPARTLIGLWLSSGNGFTRVRSFDGRILYVRTNAIALV
jgi:hypothetical protein